jgi:hypothetical protein
MASVGEKIAAYRQNLSGKFVRPSSVIAKGINRMRNINCERNAIWLALKVKIIVKL